MYAPAPPSALERARRDAAYQAALLDAPAAPAFDRLARLAARLLDAPIALVALVDDRRQLNKACVGLAGPFAAGAELPLSHSLCARVVAGAEPLVLDDARAHPLLGAHPAVTELGVAAYAGVPLVTAAGGVLGTVCVADTRPRAWPADVVALLTDLAGAAVTEVELRVAAAAVEVAAAAAEREARLRLVMEQLPAVLWTTDADLRFTSSQGRGLALIGLEPGVVTGQTVGEFIGSADPAVLPVAAHRRALSGQSTAYEMAHGGVVFDVHVEPLVGADGQVTGTVGLAVDVTARRVLEEQLEHQAFHDPLTGLANRALFRNRVEHALQRAARGDGVAVLFLDIDDFKAVNDSLGHPAGDALLEAVAHRLLQATRGSDTVARLGGDEFAVLLEGAAAHADAVAAAERVRAALDAPVQLAGREVRIGASLGLAHALPGEGPAELLRNADVAMYEAKAAGKGRYVVFEPAMHHAVLERLELEGDLRRALDATQPGPAPERGGGLRLMYQPLVEVATGRVVAFEALARWEHPTRGPVPPLTFVTIAEETGLIVPLGRWVLREACRQLRRWSDALPPGAAPTVGVNLSGRQLDDDGLVGDIAAALGDAGVPAGKLTLEITESVLMRRADALARLRAVKAVGVRLAVDDFGTGYSSLSYLHRFPVDALKIDRAFVEGVSRAGSEGAVARAILALGSALKLRTVAEGVERADQLDALRALGCDLAQGYLFAEALDAEAAGKLLAG